MSGTDNLLLEQDGAVAVLTVNRPDKLNALDAALVDELDARLATLAADDSVRALLVTGAGPKAFVAGADIAELARNAPLQGRATSRRGQQVLCRLERLGKPVVAALNGFTLGGGLELALACHVRLAAASARLGLPEITLGIIPGYGGTQRLARLVGRGRALELMLTGEMIGAEEAHRIGLVNQVFAPDALLAEARALAAKLAARAPIAARFILDAVLDGQDLPLDAGLALEATLFGLIASTADTQEGLKAFLDKRSPRFQGR